LKKEGIGMSSKVRRWSVVVVIGMLVGSWSAATAEESLESVAKRMEEVGSKLKSMSATQIIEVQSESADFKMVSHTSGKYEYTRKGDTTLWRLESETTSVSTVAGKEVKSDQKVTMVCDGKFNYTVTDMMGQTSAMKSAIQKNINSVAGKGFFEHLKKDNTLKLLPEDKVDGKAAYVIEAIPTSKGPEVSISRTHYFMLKESGIVAKTIMFDSQGKPMTTVVMTNLKINPDIPGERFVFKAPAGVQLLDTEAMKNRHKQAPEKKP
jgi:outer membrane lipoprotein-sorting protein